MALRVSALSNTTEIDLQGVNGDADGAAVGIEFGAELMRFAESVASRDEALEHRRRELLEAAGPAVLGGRGRRGRELPAHDTHCRRDRDPRGRHVP